MNIHLFLKNKLQKIIQSPTNVLDLSMNITIGFYRVYTFTNVRCLIATLLNDRAGFTQHQFTHQSTLLMAVRVTLVVD